MLCCWSIMAVFNYGDRWRSIDDNFCHIKKLYNIWHMIPYMPMLRILVPKRFKQWDTLRYLPTSEEGHTLRDPSVHQSVSVYEAVCLSLHTQMCTTITACYICISIFHHWRQMWLPIMKTVRDINGCMWRELQFLLAGTDWIQGWGLLKLRSLISP